MATPAQQSSSATALPMLVKKQTLLPSITSIQKRNILTIGGDMNAQIGKNVSHKFSLHNSSNRNGEHLINFMLENTLTCLNTKFQKRKGKLLTCTYANNTKAQMDYILWIRNGIIAHWIVKHIPLLRVCPPITKMLWQRYNWAYEEMQPEQPQLYTMTGPCLTTGILEINIH